MQTRLTQMLKAAFASAYPSGFSLKSTESTFTVIKKSHRPKILQLKSGKNNLNYPE